MIADVRATKNAIRSRLARCFPATVKKERWSKVAGKPANERGTTRL